MRVALLVTACFCSTVAAQPLPAESLGSPLFGSSTTPSARPVALATRLLGGLDVEWTLVFEGADGSSAPQARLVGAEAAPDGGLFVLGSVQTKTGGDDVLVARLTPEGAVDWAVALDGGGTADTPSAYDGIDQLLTDDIVVGGTSTGPDGTQRSLTARLGPDGAIGHFTLIDGVEVGPSTWGVAGASGGMVVSTREVVSNDRRVWLTRLDDDGAVIWRRLLVTSYMVYPLRTFRTPDGFAVVVPREGDVPLFTTIHVAPDGAVQNSFYYFDFGCPGSYPNAASAAADASGQIFVGVDNAGDCQSLKFVRFDLDGSYTTEAVVGGADDVEALAARPTGELALAYSEAGSSRDGVLGSTSTGAVRWNAGAFFSGQLLDIKAEPNGGALACGISHGSDAAAFAFDGDGTRAEIGLPALSGSPTFVYHTCRVQQTGDGTGYLVFSGSDGSAHTASVSRLSGLSVTSEDGPGAETARLVLTGSNPIVLGVPLRITLGEAATVELADALGRRLGTWELREGTHALAVGAPAPGLYLVRAHFAEGAETVRVVVR